MKYLDFVPELHYPDQAEIQYILYHDRDTNPYEHHIAQELPDEMQYPSHAFKSRATFEREILNRQGDYPTLIMEVGSFVVYWARGCRW